MTSGKANPTDPFTTPAKSAIPTAKTQAEGVSASMPHRYAADLNDTSLQAMAARSFY